MKRTTTLGRTEKNRNKPPPFCKNGKHNTAITSHLEGQCWEVHPELRPVRNRHVHNNHHQVANHVANNPRNNLPGDNPANDSFAKPAFAAFTTKTTTSNVIILDSGASHHMFNNPSYFSNLASCSIPISTGKGEGQLLDKGMGAVMISLSADKHAQLHNSLFVPEITWNQVLLG